MNMLRAWVTRDDINGCCLWLKYPTYNNRTNTYTIKNMAFSGIPICDDNVKILAPDRLNENGISEVDISINIL